MPKAKVSAPIKVRAPGRTTYAEKGGRAMIRKADRKPRIESSVRAVGGRRGPSRHVGYKTAPGAGGPQKQAEPKLTPTKKKSKAIPNARMAEHTKNWADKDKQATAPPGAPQRKAAAPRSVRKGGTIGGKGFVMPESLATGKKAFNKGEATLKIKKHNKLTGTIRSDFHAGGLNVKVKAMDQVGAPRNKFAVKPGLSGGGKNNPAVLGSGHDHGTNTQMIERKGSAFLPRSSTVLQARKQSGVAMMKNAQARSSNGKS
jgi:hypothetical protein